MTVLTLRAKGRARPDEVWERYARPERWPDWAPQIGAVRTSADRIAPGVTGSVDGPAGISAEFTIDSVDEDAGRWSWTVKLGPARVRLEHGVRAEGSGSSAWLTFDGPLPLVLPYAPIARLALGKVVAPSA